MRRFGPSKTALHFRRAKKRLEGNQETEADEPQKYRLEEGDGTSHAQRIVHELYDRYKTQLKRWKDYRNLFVFLGFVALFLAVLYLQRNAHVAYKVHSTIESVVVPSDNVMQDQQAVYDWMGGLLQEVWKDPVCGDGLCEAPFEFASYSRFGCRADCGRLSEIQNLTKVQIDIYYDFSHPVGSIPASDLMQQASWNLCPVNTAYASDCYYDSDQQFDRLASSMSVPIEDAPDGQWTLAVRRDIFSKIRGAVRDTTLVYAAAYYNKIYIAAAAAMAEQDFEIGLLRQAANFSTMDFWAYANTTIRAGYSNATEYEAAAAWVKNTTCFCDTFYNNTAASGDLFNSTILFLNQSVMYNDSSARWNMSLSQYKADPYYCPTTFAPTVWVPGNDSYGNWTKTLQPLAYGGNYSLIADYCSTGLGMAMAWRTNMTTTVQRLMVDRRLGDQSKTGKYATRLTVSQSIRNWMTANRPELVTPIFTTPTGGVALQDPINARLEVLMALYVDGVVFQTQQPMRAFLNATRRVVYNPSVHLLDLAPRALARIAEVLDSRADMRTIQIPTPLKAYRNYTFANATVGAIYDTFVAANATNRTVPAPSTAALGPYTFWYNLASWAGNTTAYMRCDLEDRGDEYVGQCVAMNNTCASTNSDTTPYTCTDLTSPTNATITGNLTFPDYRARCEAPCDRRLDCNTICECYGTCGATEYCECDACVALNVNAAADTQFVDIRSIVQDQAAASASIADMGIQPGRRRRSRALLTTNEELASQLSSVLTQVGTVSTQQTSIATQMSSLKAQVDRANQLAEARANDNRLVDLISAGRADIQAGQARVEAKLDEIIGKQNQALAAAEDAAKSLSALQGLSERQLAAQKALETAVTNQLSAIKTATYQNIITLTQALVLWKRARRDRALTLKAAKLANIPCNSAPKVDNLFGLDNGNVVDTTTSRERNIGLTNRVIAGMLLHQTRTNDTLCPESKFDKIQRTCTGPETLASFGVDPVFKRGTTSYNPDFDDLYGTAVTGFYNCSQLSRPTYNVMFLNQTVNPQPYCAELYNPQGLPYAFHFFPLEGKPDGFPVWFDINLAEDGATQWYTYLSEGLYLDQNTRSMTAEIVTYNAPLRIFGYYYVKFFFSDGGSIKITHRLNTVRVELYNGGEDDVRFAAEIILSGWIFILFLYSLWEIAWTQRTEGNFLKYFYKGWHWVEFISNTLLAVCVIIWWTFVRNYANPFNIAIRYNVYSGLTASANYLALDKDGANLVGANAAILQLRELVDMLNWYFALNGINILLLIGRVLKLMDFQPRLGVVTRSLWKAGPDLLHFAIVAGMVFVGYAMMAHLIFGNAIQAFATFGDSINTCFEILLGNIDVNGDLRALGGLQSVAGALFFWSYELLVFMVLLNFLLAIIVDAFAEVKEQTHETVGIHTELYTLLRDKWRGMLGSCASNYISDAKLGTLLRQWAGQDDKDGDESGAAAAAENSRRLLTVLNEDIDEDTLKEVLRECLREAQAEDDAAGAKGGKAGGLLSRCFGRGATSKVGSGDPDTELVQAAHYIVERFGFMQNLATAEEEVEEVGQETAQVTAVAGAGSGGGREAALEKERDQLAQALERLAEVQRELAEGQRNLMAGQKQLAEQQGKLVQLMNEQPPSGA